MKAPRSSFEVLRFTVATFSPRTGAAARGARRRSGLRTRSDGPTTSEAAAERWEPGGAWRL
jgi:hypothetical protein